MAKYFLCAILCFHKYGKIPRHHHEFSSVRHLGQVDKHVCCACAQLMLQSTRSVVKTHPVAVFMRDGASLAEDWGLYLKITVNVINCVLIRFQGMM